MKKLWIVMVLALVLCGCAGEMPEYLEDVYGPELIDTPALISVQLPEDACVQSVNSDVGSIYFCDGYEIAIQTLPAGNLNKTIEDVTGFPRERLTVLQTRREGNTCYECVWTSAGEAGDQIGRAMILDDGSYHYCLYVMAPADEAGSLQLSWQQLFDSFALQPA